MTYQVQLIRQGMVEDAYDCEDGWDARLTLERVLGYELVHNGDCMVKCVALDTGCEMYNALCYNGGCACSCNRLW